jgi:hypothetical protein
MKSVIFTLAKYESQYIEEFVIYHLGIGFSQIYIYDNEDVPTYSDLLHKYVSNGTVIVIHLPFNHFDKGIQQIMIDHFIANYMFTNEYTHCCAIDVDEFIVLKQHTHIHDFIKQFIVDDVAGISINWRFFGSSNLTINDGRPVTQRFTMRQLNYNPWVKTIFEINKFSHFRSVHVIEPKESYVVKDTDGNIVTSAFTNNKKINNDVVQINHYATKTFDEFCYQRKRGCCNTPTSLQPIYNMQKMHMERNFNHCEDLLACNIYKSILSKETDAKSQLCDSTECS